MDNFNRVLFSLDLWLDYSEIFDQLMVRSILLSLNFFILSTTKKSLHFRNGVVHFFQTKENHSIEISIYFIILSMESVNISEKLFQINFFFDKIK